MDDQAWMNIALEEARAAAAVGDVPVGAVIVRDGSILGRGRNRRELDRDPTAHAEIVALRDAAHALGMWRVEATLYVTQEPCPMCAGALVNARVTRLVYGCPNPKAGAVKSLFSIVDDPRLNHRVEVADGVRADECAEVLRQFFAELRKGPTYGEP
jgi:tRNA(adenine34) deaminase